MKPAYIMNEDIGSVFSDSEKKLLHKDGAWCHEHGMKRASNPHTLPESRGIWERGWIDDQIARRKAYMRQWYLENKARKAKAND